MTLSPAWTKGACNAGEENSLIREQNQRAEWSRNGLETPTFYTKPRGNTKSPKLNSSHSPQPIEAGGNAGALHSQSAPGTKGTAGARIICKAHTGSGVWHGGMWHNLPQTTLSCPMAYPSSCSLQSPMAAAIKPWAHPGRANTRHNQALAQDAPWSTQPCPCAESQNSLWQHQSSPL